MIWRILLVVVLGSVATNRIVDAKSNVTTPTVTWLASSVPDNARIEVSKIVVTNSSGQMKLKTHGQCAVQGKYLTTKNVGSCKIELQIATTPNFMAIALSQFVQVKKRSELNVLAAASLKDALDAISKTFMSQFLNVTVKSSFAGSSTLATQIQQGAPVDIVAMADLVNMERVLNSGDIDRKSVRVFARNKLAILVQRGNPKNVNSLSDLTRTELKVVLCDISQPCGKYSQAMLTKAKVSFTVASREASASGVVSRVALGEADAGIAYFTDGLVAGDKVDAVKISDKLNVIAEYPIAVAVDPTTKDLSVISGFLSTVEGKIGRKIFSQKGFELP